jgi:hypothetical protein
MLFCKPLSVMVTAWKALTGVVLVSCSCLAEDKLSGVFYLAWLVIFLTEFGVKIKISFWPCIT